jgi:hypothetical protein
MVKHSILDAMIPLTVKAADALKKLLDDGWKIHHAIPTATTVLFILQKEEP